MNISRNTLRRDAVRIFLICVAGAIMALNIKSFVRAGGLFPGGATGLTLLFQRAFRDFLHIELPYTILNLALNAIPIYIGFRFIGVKFTGYSVLMILVTNFLTDLLPGYTITYDPLLISIFGGLINGVVISLCLRENATTGGTDFISIFLSEKKGMDGFNIVLGINAGILLAAGFLFGWDKALYSIIFQYVSTQTIHFLYKNYQQETLFIVTDYPEKMAEAIHEISHHGATILEGEGSYNHQPRKIVYSVIGSADHTKIMKAVREVDPNVFVNVVRTQQLEGRFYFKPYE